jgi:hypothetical protein
MENLVNNFPRGKAKEVSVGIESVPVGLVFSNKTKRNLRKSKEKVESCLRSWFKNVFTYYF